MAATAILALLTKEIGFPIAKKILANLPVGNSSNEKFRKVIDATNNGKAALDAIRDIFGADFDAALSKATDAGKGGWSYEAGRNEYIKLEVVGDRKAIIDLLRKELNINLDRICAIANRDKTAVNNYFRGLFSEWMDRYKELIGQDSDAQSTFESIDKLLDGSNRTFKDAYKLIAQTGTGSVGALLIINGVMIATSTGVGVWASFHTWAMGVPVLQVWALVASGALLLALSRYTFRDAHAMTTCVKLAYKLLERRKGQVSS